MDCIARPCSSSDTHIAGTTLYNKVYAEDAAGHSSQVIVSDGVTVDTTPPAALDMVYTNGVNLLDNPSFEADTALNANLTQCDAQPPTSWEVSVTSYCDVFRWHLRTTITLHHRQFTVDTCVIFTSFSLTADYWHL